MKKLKILLYVPTFLAFTSCGILNMFPDNPIEEAAEDFIKDNTGVEVDFTGNSPER